MALYLEVESGSFELFDGSQLLGSGDGACRVNAAAVEACWSVEACEAVGLYRPEPADAVPEGKIVTGTGVARVGGVVKFVHTLEDYVEPVPGSITMRQARLALLGAGLLNQVEGSIDALPEPTRSAARIEWEYAADMHRDHALIASLAAGLNMSDEQIDNLFKAAAAL